MRFWLLFFSFIATDKNILIFQDCTLAVNLNAFGFIFLISTSKIVADFPPCVQTTSADLVVTTKPGEDDNDGVMETKLCPF